MAHGVTEPSDDALAHAKAAVQSLFLADRVSQALGIEVVDVVPGRVRVAMTVRSDMVNGHGICHGGIIFTLADSAFAFSCNSLGEAMVAAGASIEFLAPAPNGERVIATASAVSRTQRHGIYDVVVTKISGEVLAHFRGRCSRLRQPGKAAQVEDNR
jgi:acyl-CoA thioesterase